MSKTLFRAAFWAVLTTAGCSTPMNLFAKKPQSFQEYRDQEMAKLKQVPSSSSARGGPAEVAELFNKGDAAWRQGNTPEAQANYLQVLKRQPNHATANHRLAVIADGQQDFYSAERYYQTALATAPTDANMLNDLGYSYLMQSRFPEAEQYLQKSLQRNPSQNKAINNLGTLYAKQGRADQALALFRRSNNEAEAQAKLAQLMPAATNPAANAMLANGNFAGPQNTGPQNFAPPNTAPQNAANVAWGPGASGPGNRLIPTQPQGQSQFIPTQMQAQTQFIPNQGQPQPALAATQPGFNDSTETEPVRQLREAMERERLKAVSIREARDLAERQRREFLLKQVRQEAFGPTNVIPAGDSQVTGMNREMVNPNLTARDPRTIGSSVSNANPIPNSSFTPASPTRPDEYRSPPDRYSAPPNDVPNPNWGAGNSGTPLDNMPAWPPNDSLPTINRSGASSANGMPFNSPTNSWPNGANSNMADDPARMASRMGMNAGPGGLFPITPGPSSASSSSAPSSSIPNGFAPNTGSAQNQNRSAIQPPAWQNGRDFSPSPNLPPNMMAPQFNGPPSSVPSNGFAPSSGNSPREQFAPGTGEPPSGTFGPGSYNSSSNRPALPESPTQFALRGQVPPSEHYQTPSNFGTSRGPINNSTQPASYGTNRSASPNSGAPNPREMIAEMERASMRSANPNRSEGDERWEQGGLLNGQSAQVSAPITQGFLATPADDRSLTEYERMMQMHDSETNAIRQQIDQQRQMPGSENYSRPRTQRSPSTPTGADPFRR